MAQQPGEDDLIHWAYGAYFGTGHYELPGSESTWMLGIRPGWEWRESALSEDGERRLGYRFRLALALGTSELNAEALLDDLELENVSTLSVVPGVEIEIPMTPRWTLKPLAYVGRGVRLDSSAASWIYWVGIRSQLRFSAGKTDWWLVNALTRVGYSPNTAASGSVLPLMTGFEFRRPLEKRKIGDETVFLNWHLSYTNYLDELGFDFGSFDVQSLDVDSEWELGIGFSRGDRKLRLWRLSWDRVGIAYRFDASGDFTGVRLVFKSLFDR